MKQRPEAVSKPCSAWAAQAAGRESSRNLIVSPGESICISLEEGKKTWGSPLVLLSWGKSLQVNSTGLSSLQQTQSAGSSGGVAAAGVQCFTPLAWAARTWQGASGTVPGKAQTLLTATESGWKAGIPPCAHPTAVCKGLPMSRRARPSHSSCCLTGLAVRDC